jgi:gluconolactonase
MELRRTGRAWAVVAALVGVAACAGAPGMRDAGTGGAGTGGEAGTGGGGTSAGGGAVDAAAEASTSTMAGADAQPEVGAPSDARDGNAAARTIGDLYCPPAAGAYPSPIVGTVQATQIPIAPPDGIMFLEGPVWVAERGVLLLSEWTGGHRILQLTPPATIEVFLSASRTNGLALAPDGQALLVVREAPGTSVSRLRLSDKGVEALVEGYEGKPFVQPNDLAVRADGTIFFTDYQAGRLYRRASDGKVTIVSSLAKSNGVGLSPDEKTLYLNADTRTVKYPVADDGSVGAGAELVTGLRGADGLAIDCAGNVYVAQNDGGGVVVVSAAGAKLGEIGGLPRAVTNAAFGGAERKTLYVTTSSALHAVELAVPGLPY